MPIYEFRCKCQSCSQKVVELFTQKYDPPKLNCETCGKPMEKLFPSRLGKDSWPEDGMTLDHIAEQPMHFKTKNDLRKYCRAKGLSSGALL